MIQKLYILAGILTVLFCLFLLQKQAKQEKTSDLFQELEARSALKREFPKVRIVKIEIYSDRVPEKPLVLSQTSGRWRIESHFQARADSDFVQSFLNTLQELSGEVRHSTPEALKDFHLDEKSEDALFRPLHIKAYCEGREEASYHLLIGKKIFLSPENNPNLPLGGKVITFVRPQGSLDVYAVEKDLKAKMMLFQEKDILQGIPPGPWLAKVIELEKEEKESIVVLSWKYKQSQFVLRKLLKTLEIPTEETRSQSSKQNLEEWQIEQGPVEKKSKLSFLRSFFSHLSSFEAVDVLDSKWKAELGFNDCPMEFEFQTKDGKRVRLIAVQPSSKEDGYCMREDEPGIIYKVSHGKFREIFQVPYESFE